MRNLVLTSVLAGLIGLGVGVAASGGSDERPQGGSHLVYEGSVDEASRTEASTSLEGILTMEHETAQAKGECHDVSGTMPLARCEFSIEVAGRRLAAHGFIEPGATQTTLTLTDGGGEVNREPTLNVTRVSGASPLPTRLHLELTTAR